jgi:hypothetical protein
MPNVTQLIRNVAQSRRVQQSIVEKDYALSYLRLRSPLQTD